MENKVAEILHCPDTPFAEYPSKHTCTERIPDQYEHRFCRWCIHCLNRQVDEARRNIRLNSRAETNKVWPG